MVEKLTPERERALSTYALLLAALKSLAAGGGPTVVPAFIVKLLSISGYHPQLQMCAGCGNGGELSAFSSSLGGAICEMCWRDDREAVRLASDRIELLGRFLLEDFGHPAEAAEINEVTQVLKSYTEYHLERPLRSLKFLAAN
jgi:DNA repair protein RecO (recombination protein O)